MKALESNDSIQEVRTLASKGWLNVESHMRDSIYLLRDLLQGTRGNQRQVDSIINGILGLFEFGGSCVAPQDLRDFFRPRRAIFKAFRELADNRLSDSSQMCKIIDDAIATLEKYRSADDIMHL